VGCSAALYLGESDRDSNTWAASDRPMARPVPRETASWGWTSSLPLSAVGCCHASLRAAVAGTVVDRNRRPVAGAEVVFHVEGGMAGASRC
jgi:hypothetical protein